MSEVMDRAGDTPHLCCAPCVYMQVKHCYRPYDPSGMRKSRRNGLLMASEYSANVVGRAANLAATSCIASVMCSQLLMGPIDSYQLTFRILALSQRSVSVKSSWLVGTWLTRYTSCAFKISQDARVRTGRLEADTGVEGRQSEGGGEEIKQIE